MVEREVFSVILGATHRCYRAGQVWSRGLHHLVAQLQARMWRHVELSAGSQPLTAQAKIILTSLSSWAMWTELGDFSAAPSHHHHCHHRRASREGK